VTLVSFWSILGLVLQSVATNPTSNDVKIQIRRPHDQIRRDNGFVSNNPDSVQNALLSARSAHPDADVRAVDSQGRTIDFR
jgi:hypothetical protein